MNFIFCPLIGGYPQTCLNWLEFIHKTVDISFKTCVCYLPPSNSTRGVDFEEFFNNLVTQVAEYQSDTQPFIICGDFNARCADIPDHIEGVDDLPPVMSLTGL